jgi:hypothetical protein
MGRTELALPWVRLDTQFPSNPKVLELVARKRHPAAFAYLCSLAYAGQHGTDGYIPEAALPFIHATKALANHLVEVGLWVPSPGGWLIHGWDEFQISDEEAKRRRERAQNAAAKRWENTKKGHLRGI